ncbi:hypothetical protein B0T20DRAFT_464739 [Sordaria brevicollis]|uniref:Peptidase S8/S53 domain-containing protein n=1 Tax=Sordaria brevicollis TaxID=83679 RepID=A0AAE0NWV3_SORBR|nr:hypothetical protein B0T20DRAFT_464739 [Sordaria brevicollis]
MRRDLDPAAPNPMADPNGTDGDDDSDFSEDENENQLKDTLKHALSDIIADKVSFMPEDSQSLASFTGKYGEVLFTSPEAGPNALHLLVTEPDLPMPRLELLGDFVTYLVKHGNKLLETQDGDGFTPLMRAISAKKKKDRKEERMAGWMIHAHPNIGPILAITDPQKRNCIHAAVLKRRRQHLSRMIKEADPQTVAAKDSSGNTPLHYAVQYDYFRGEKWLGIIKDLATKSETVTRIDGGDLNNDRLSPYLYHIQTWKQKTSLDDKDRRKEKAEYRRMHAESMLPNPSPYSTGPAALGGHLPLSPDEQRENRPTVMTPSPAEHASRGPKKSTKDQETSRVEEDISERVEQFLKLHYLRNRSENDCRSILYHRELTPDFEDRLLNFDLVGRTNMAEADFGKLIDTFKFQEFLQYVAIPKMQISGSHTPTDGRTRQVEQSGRTDLSLVFDELRSSKGVKRVLKVVVDDTLQGFPPHSDETIESSLKNLAVEIWDWKRYDLCSEVIYNAAPKVREVYLYSTGNNAVLRSWSDQGGLRKLEHLKKVHVQIKQRRMREAMPDVLLTVEEPKTQQKKPTNHRSTRIKVGPAPAMGKNDWIECMTNFRQFLYNAEKNHGNKKKVWESMEDPIKVALIDDGVDVAQLSKGTATLIGGRTFCSKDETNHFHPWYASDDPLEDGHLRQPTAESAAQAIYAAIDKGVHIISMSWTINVKDGDPNGNVLDRAVNAAAEKGILMFCSASDKGANVQHTYPAKATKNIFKIGAAKDSGAVDEWVGDLSLIDFTFPGNKVDGEGNRASGSSVATAYAAGLAALILYCVQVRLYLAPDEGKEKAREQFGALQKHNTMLETFKHTIGTTPWSEYKFVQVWRIFGDARDKQDKNPGRMLEVVAEIGDKLCTNV